MSGSKFRASFVLLLVLSVTVLMVGVVWPFLKTLLLSAIFSGLVHPVFTWLARCLGGHRSLASFLTVLLLFLLIVGPISLLSGAAVKQAMEVSQRAAPWVQQQFGAAQRFDVHQWVGARWPAVADLLPSQSELAAHAANTAKAAGSFLVENASAVTAGTAGLLLRFFLLLYSMFFFLKDGRKMLEKILYYCPLRPDEEALVLERFAAVTKATVKGTLLIGAIQGSLAGVGFFFAGIEGSVFWGAVMIVLSAIPGIGSALVWVPAVIYLLVSGQTLAGILLGTWCACVVGVIDNLLRPILVGKEAGMSDFLVMFGALGGLLFFGPFGFIVGPIVCGLFLTVWEPYGVAFQSILPPVKSLRETSGGLGSEPPEASTPLSPRENDN
jgi:predicted PurR-regulated permease PerM